jgi:hypothetical protein
MGGQGNVSTVGHLGGVLVAGALRTEVQRVLGLRTLKYRWHRMRMRNRLRGAAQGERKRKTTIAPTTDRPSPSDTDETQRATRLTAGP